MMSFALSLEVLKYLGLMVSALAGYWSLTKKTTFEDGTGLLAVSSG